ncbi:class II fumarate hydratase [Prochlorococcus sp. MIT 1300]|uniref:class II fumarate hydratase n=1 Tax=Prochlorococcus sp. MIT 1300 TaxID=3096218 RepID=UPI002A752E09|nr:class II fumarate hydratase [Prochlorococcus sp. MIT 1300]
MAELIRIEKDSLGAVEVPKDVLWGAQTQRSLKNFAVQGDLVPIAIVYSLAKIKQASAIANHDLGVLDTLKQDLIIKATKEIIAGIHDNQFPLTVWQTGSGTHTNMNVNEVISNLASVFKGEVVGSYKPIHPNDHVNLSQSTNDTFPSAIHIAATEAITKKLLPELKLLINTFAQKSRDWKNIVKTGRTHLQDAVPITLGQEVSAWETQLIVAYNRLKDSLKELYPLPIGGTAVGTGINAPSQFDKKATLELARLTKLPFTVAQNKFAVMASHDGLVNTMSQARLLAVALLKIYNDLRLLSCGPRTGFAELELPDNEPGSSIMPGKVNPTQCESMAMICTQIMGLDAAVAMAGSGGHLQMNAYKPLIGFNLLHSLDLLHDACRNSRVAMVEGMKPNQNKIEKDLNQSLMLVTALAPKIGYEKASQIAHHAHKNGLSLRSASMQLGYITKDEFDEIVNPARMTTPDKTIS